MVSYEFMQKYFFWDIGSFIPTALCDSLKLCICAGSVIHLTYVLQ